MGGTLWGVVDTVCGVVVADSSLWSSVCVVMDAGGVVAEGLVVVTVADGVAVVDERVGTSSPCDVVCNGSLARNTRCITGRTAYAILERVRCSAPPDAFRQGRRRMPCIAGDGVCLTHSLGHPMASLGAGGHHHRLACGKELRQHTVEETKVAMRSSTTRTLCLDGRPSKTAQEQDGLEHLARKAPPKTPGRRKAAMRL